MVRKLVLALSFAAACGGGGGGASESSQAGDGGADSLEEATEDASDAAAETGDDGASGDATTSDVSDAGEEVDYLETGVSDVNGAPKPCASPLQDAGFTSLSNLPVASMCATYGHVWEGLPPCQGTILVSVPPSFGPSYWLFDASTGALEAAGYADDGNYGCTGGLPSFPFPYQCLYYGGWPQQTDLCADAGAVISD